MLSPIQTGLLDRAGVPAYIAVMAETDPDDRQRAAVRRRRRSHLLNHFIAYFAVMVVVVPINYLTTPQTPWFLAVLVGWGAPLAVHTAWVMELFGNRPR